MRMIITHCTYCARCMPWGLARTTYGIQGPTNELKYWSEHGKASGNDSDVGFDGRPDSSVGIVPGDVHLRQLQ